MGFFQSLGKFVTGIVTPPGTHAAQSQRELQSNTANQIGGLVPQSADIYRKQQQFQQEQMPFAQAGVRQLANATTAGGRAGQWASFQGQANANAQSQFNRNKSMFTGNPALQDAYRMQALNQANDASNEYGAQINSSTGIHNALSQYLMALGTQHPDAQGLLGLASGVYGQPRVQVGKGLGDYLGQVAGLAMAGGGGGAGGISPDTAFKLGSGGVNVF